jgi:hypothetical protein
MGQTSRTVGVHFDGDAKGLDRAARQGKKDMEAFARDVNKSTVTASKGAKALSQEIDNTTRQISALKAKFDETGDMRLLKSLDKEERNLKKFNGQLDRLKGGTNVAAKSVGFLAKASADLAPAFDQAAKSARFMTNPIVLIGAVAAAALIAIPALSVAAGVALAGVGLGFLGLGAVALKNSAAIKNELGALGETVSGVGKRAASALEDEFVDALKVLGRTAQRVEPSLTRIFGNLQPAVLSLAVGINGLATEAMPGLEHASAGANTVLQMVAAVMPELGAAVGDFGDSMGDAADGGGAALVDLIGVLSNSLRTLGNTIEGAARAYDFLMADGGKQKFFPPIAIARVFNQVITGSGDALSGAGDAATDHSEKLIGLSAAALEATVAAQELNDTLAGKTLSLAETQTRAAQGAVDLAEAMKTGGKEWRNSTVEGRQNQVALQGAANDAFRMRDAVVAAATAQGRGATAAAEGSAALAVYAGGLRQTMRDAGLSDAKIDELFRSIGLLPSSKQIPVSVPGADHAAQQLRDLDAAENRISRLVSIQARVTGASSAMGTLNQLKAQAEYNERRAAGGRAGAGRSYLVGENGPEILHMGPREGHISPNSTVGGNTVVYVTIDGEQLQGRIDRTIREGNRQTKRRVLAGAGAA